MQAGSGVKLNLSSAPPPIRAPPASAPPQVELPKAPVAISQIKAPVPISQASLNYMILIATSKSVFHDMLPMNSSVFCFVGDLDFTC